MSSYEIRLREQRLNYRFRVEKCRWYVRAGLRMTIDDYVALIEAENRKKGASRALTARGGAGKGDETSRAQGAWRRLNLLER